MLNLKCLVFLFVLWLFSADCERMPATLNMDLGKAYNLNTFDAGDRVFKLTSIQNPVIIPEYQSSVRFKVIRSKEDMKDMLNINGALSLAIQAGATSVDVSASGGYLKENVQNSNFVEVMAVMDIRTVTKTLTRDAKFSNRLSRAIKKNTHYVRSISYGCRLIASLKATAKTESEKEDINVKAKLELKTGGGAFGIGVEGQFKQFKSAFQNSDKTEIKVFTTLGTGSTSSTSIDSLLEKIKAFPSECQGDGVPLYAELVPIDTLPQTTIKDANMKDNQMKMLLKRTSEEYNDLVTTQTAINTEGKNNFNKSIRKKLSELQAKLDPILQKYSEAITKITTQENAAAIETIQEARTVYIDGSDVGGVPGSYLKLFNIIMKKNDADDSEREVSTYLDMYRFSSKVVSQINEELKMATKIKDTITKMADDLKNDMNVDQITEVTKQMKQDSESVCNVVYYYGDEAHQGRTEWNIHGGEFLEIKYSGLYLMSANRVVQYNSRPMKSKFTITSKTKSDAVSKTNISSSLYTCDYGPTLPLLKSALGLTIVKELKKGQLISYIWPELVLSKESTSGYNNFMWDNFVLLKPGKM